MEIFVIAQDHITDADDRHTRDKTTSRTAPPTVESAAAKLKLPAPSCGSVSPLILPHWSSRSLPAEAASTCEEFEKVGLRCPKCLAPRRCPRTNWETKKLFKLESEGERWSPGLFCCSYQNHWAPRFTDRTFFAGARHFIILRSIETDFPCEHSWTSILSSPEKQHSFAWLVGAVRLEISPRDLSSRAFERTRKGAQGKCQIRANISGFGHGTGGVFWTRYRSTHELIMCIV